MTWNTLLLPNHLNISNQFPVTVLHFQGISYVISLPSNSSIISPSTFLFPNPNPPCTPSKPSTPAPTCPFKSPPISNFSPSSISDTIFPNKMKNSSFSGIGLPACGAYAEIKFSTVLPTIILTTISLLLTRPTSSTFSIHLSATSNPTHEFLSSSPSRKNLYSPNFLAPSPFHPVQVDVL